jgi:hypothetical protein
LVAIKKHGKVIAAGEPPVCPYHLFCLGLNISNTVLTAEMQPRIGLENNRILMAPAALHALTYFYSGG